MKSIKPKNNTDMLTLLQASGVIDEVFFLLSSGKPLDELAKKAEISAEQLDGLSRATPKLASKYIASRLSYLASISLTKISHAPVSMDKEESAGFKHHLKIIEAAIKANASITSSSGSGTNISISNVTMIPSTKDIPIPPMELE